MFGMHPNAEIGYLTATCETLFDTILSVQGGSGGGGGAKDDIVMSTLMDFKTRTPPEHSLLDITAKIKEKTPAIVVCLQEIERMNLLLAEIKRTLEDLRLGLTGALNMTDAMENLQKSLQYNKVPSSWETVAYPSKKVLSMWFNELLDRNNQLVEWSKDLITPKSLCIAYLFNPMSFLTAIMQNTARSKLLPLDNMTLLTNVTLFKAPEEVTAPAENGSYIHGLWLEGAAWELGAPGQEGYLIEQRPKELHPKMPIINVVAVPLKDKREAGQYQCPVYYTSLRGQTYIFTANLNMESEDSDPSKWILSGTCMLMSED
jgi:dynein heavy chain